MKADNSGKFFTIDDFKVGENVVIYGKNIKISGCDQYTKEFFSNIGNDQLED